MNLLTPAKKNAFLVFAGTIIFGLMDYFGNLNSLDAQFFYTQANAETFLAAMSSEELKRYLTNEYLDLGFIASYSLLFASLSNRYSLFTKTPWLSYIPGVFDLVETIQIIFILKHSLSSVPFWLGYVTSAKWISGTLLLTYIIYSAKKFRSADVDD